MAENCDKKIYDLRVKYFNDRTAELNIEIEIKKKEKYAKYIATVHTKPNFCPYLPEKTYEPFVTNDKYQNTYSNERKIGQYIYKAIDGNVFKVFLYPDEW